MKRDKGSILVGVLWCVALLSVIVVGSLHSSRMDLVATENYGDRIQARYLALAGIEKAKALLYQDARDRSRSLQNHTGNLYDDPQDFRDVQLGRGQYRVFRSGRDNEKNSVIYGISDEESRLNINQATTNELSQIYGISPDIIAAIIDWRDTDSTVTPGGAEADYYMSLRPPRLPRNSSFLSVRELLMVRGISRDLLLGDRAQEDPLLSFVDDQPAESAPPENPASLPNTGWESILTVDSSVQDVNAGGQDRVNVQNADQATLTGVNGINANMAQAIISYRGQNQFKSIADLLNVTPAQNQNQSRTTSNTSGGNQSQQNGGQNSQSQNNQGGGGVIDQQLLMQIGDDITVASDQTISGAININTASFPVLCSLPNMDQQVARAIINYRESDGYFANIAWLLKVPGMTTDIFQQIAPLITARSETFRILSEGKIKSSGVRQRIEVVVHIGLSDIQTLSYREDDL